MVQGFLKRLFGRAEKAPQASAAENPTDTAASITISDPTTTPPREVPMDTLLPVEIEYDWCGGNCPVQAEGTFNGYCFYFRARGEGWHIELGLPKGHIGWYGVAAWEHEEDYFGPERDAGWMGEDEAKLLIEKSARLWHRDKGWQACDKLAAEIKEEYRQRGELDESEN